MSTLALASGSRRTRASFAAPPASASTSVSQLRAGRASRRRSTTTLKSRPNFPATDSSDLDYENDIYTGTRRSFQPPQPIQQDTDDAISEEYVNQEALDEIFVLEQLTPRPNRRAVIEPVDLDTTQTALDRFRVRQKQGERIGRVSIAGLPQTTSILSHSSISNRSKASLRSRQSAQIAPSARDTGTARSRSRRMYTARSDLSAAPATSRRNRRLMASAVNFNETLANDSAGNMTMARPGQRLRPSLADADGRLDVPTIEERCAVLVINAKGVLHFYMDLYTRGWQPESFDDMLRNWTPFESYKTNQLLAEAQYMHHFIDIEEVTRSLRASGQPRPDGFDEAMKMANCATFIHYIHQLPSDPIQYGRDNSQSITSRDVIRAPLRKISELSDARRIFLRWILPFEWELSDEVLNMLLDMSIQIYINRLERIVEAVRAGEMAVDVARSAISDHLVDLMSGDVVRHSLQRVKKQRGMSRAQIEQMVQRYETFANVRQIDLQAMQYDYEAMRESFSFQSMSADLTGYVRDVVREVDAGMQSSTLPLIIDRLARESSVFSASDVAEPVPASSSVIDGGNNDASSVIEGPGQSTPKAMTRTTQPYQPFASQYANWLDDMLGDEDVQGSSQQSRPSESSRDDIDLTETQKVHELDAMLMTDDGEEASNSSIDLDIASSPPRTAKLKERLFAALNSSGRATAREQELLSEAVEASETSDATGVVESRRNRDAPFDSPAEEKASRLGFDSQNRLVRRTSPSSRKNKHLLDGSAAAVRESRFDSQGEEDEDVFLENAVQTRRIGSIKSKSKAKAEAVARTRPADEEEDDTVAQATPRPKRNLRSNAAQRQPNITEHATAAENEEDSDVNERQTARRTGSRSAARQLQLKQESLSPAKPQAQRGVKGTVVTGEQRHSTCLKAGPNKTVTVGVNSAKVARSQVGRGPNENEAATELGRGLPDDETWSQARILRTASGRLHKEGQGSDRDHDKAEHEAETARQRMGGAPEEWIATRATPDEEFIGDDDGAVLDRRAALDAAIAAKKRRPGTLHFYRPEADYEAMPLVGFDDGPPAEGENIDAIAMRNGDAIAEILHSSITAPSRHIGPFRLGNTRTRLHREERAPVVDHYSDEEVDELEDETDEPRNNRRRRNATNRAEPLRQTVHVQPYKRSNLYITGHNMIGRSRWTAPETNCLLDSLHELARYKKMAPKFKVYTEILKRHGVNGTQSRVLARWNNVQLKDKSRNELIRMKREGVRIPYWKRLLHPNIWKPPPVMVARDRRRDETEDVPDVGSDVEVPEEEGGDGEDADDSIRDGDEGEVADQVGGEDAGGIEVVIEEAIAERSSNPLRNEP